MLAQIVQMVAAAQRSRAPIQRLADRVAAWFVPAVIAVALLAFAAWATFGPEPRFAYGLVAAVTVLIIACPCALGLATPMSIMVGVGRGAQAGVLIRNAEALERMESGRHARARQDRHADRRQAQGGRDQGRRRLRRNRDAAARRQRRAIERASARRAPSSRPRPNARSSLRRCAASIRRRGKGAIGMVERRRVVLGNARFLGELEHRDRTRSKPRPSGCGATARPRSSSPSTASSPASSPSPIR